MINQTVDRNHPWDRTSIQARGGKVPIRDSPLLVSALLTLLVAVVQSGCVGLTTAKGDSTASTKAPASAPALSGTLAASPTTLNFGSVTVGSTSNQSLTVTNSGTVSVTISQVTASGTGFSIGGVPLPLTLAAGNSATFTASFAPATMGSATGSVSMASSQLSSPATIAMTGTGMGTSAAITSQPANQAVLVGQTATFSVGTSGTAPLSYQWQKNGAAISGATSASYTTPAEVISDNGAQFTVVVSNAVGSVTSSPATLTVTVSPLAPSIVTQPANQTTTVGQSAIFSVTASGTAPLSYQWRKNGTAISGATAASYTTPAEVSSDSGAQFTVVISNSAGTVTSNAATLTVNPDPVAPSITAQPASQTITAGQSATFSVTASGTAPLSYQWRKNGAAISGATAASYTTPAETTADSGAQFTIVVSNSAGTVTSNAAILTVNPAPVAPSITSQPASQTITAGQSATFSVTASGTAPLSYQWHKNGAAISGATAASYTTPAETTTDNGAQFSVLVSNSAGSVTSNAATLTVNAGLPGPLAPSTSSLNFGNVNLGNNGTLSVTLTNSGSSNITISSVTISGAGFTASGVSAGLIIAPAQIATLSVTFAPVAAGAATGNVSVVSNASNSTVLITLSGNGVQIVSHSADLLWTASTSTVSGYNTYRATVTGGPYTPVNSSLITLNRFTDSTVQAGQTYYYVVTAVSSGGVESTYSNEATATIPTP
jgi:HYDIN/CFA65/VesB family protein/centrosomal CEP192-like protein/Ig-like domain-containing protein/immunoglobulin I-set domain protein